jgi:ribosome-associated toxin RatA of RatAB toxin-antitoxin module
MVLPYSLDQVWAAVTDYDNYGDICPYVHAGEVTHDPNGTCHIEGGAVSSVSGDIPFAADVRHEQLLDRYFTTWDQPSGNVLVNRGHWILTPEGRSDTLLELTLEVQMRNVPTFILRNISMHRLPEVVRAVEYRLRTNAAGKKW